MGLSDRDVTGFSADTRLEDLEAVEDAIDGSYDFNTLASSLYLRNMVDDATDT